jgi:hypothetical protein
MTRFRATSILLAALALVAGCQAARQGARPPDEQFGHRVEGTDQEGRETVVVVPPSGDQEYRTYPAVYESVTVRPATAEPGRTDVAVEVLVKGAFPDACTELHEVSQQRSGNLIDVSLSMRRPQGAICATVLRPYRFYVLLDGRFEPGPYTLTLNGDSHPFELHEPGS